LNVLSFFRSKKSTKEHALQASRASTKEKVLFFRQRFSPESMAAAVVRDRRFLFFPAFLLISE
jgi:hypothetical protein